MIVFLGSNLLNSELSDDQILPSFSHAEPGKLREEWGAVVISLLTYIAVH